MRDRTEAERTAHRAHLPHLALARLRVGRERRSRHRQFHRKWKLDARALCKLFPDTVAADVKTRAEKDPFTAINCRVIVLPSDEYDSYGKGENGQPAKRSDAHPFVRCVIDEDHQTILEEVSQFDLGYVIPRWVTIGGFSQY